MMEHRKGFLGALLALPFLKAAVVDTETAPKMTPESFRALVDLRGWELRETPLKGGGYTVELFYSP